MSKITNTGQYTGSAPFQPSSGKKKYKRVDWTGSFFTGSRPSTFLSVLSPSLSFAVSATASIHCFLLHLGLHFLRPSSSTNLPSPTPYTRFSTLRPVRVAAVTARFRGTDAPAVRALKHTPLWQLQDIFIQDMHRTSSSVLEVWACTRNRRKPSQQPRASSRC